MPPASISNLIIESLPEMRELARDVAKTHAAGARLVLLLDGPMGAGKTQFTRYFLEALGSEETTSPSFAIHHTYETSRGAIEHFDLFRLESADDLESTGFWDLFRDRRGIVIIEWSERLREFGLFEQLPRTWPKVRLEIAILAGASLERRLVKLELLN